MSIAVPLYGFGGTVSGTGGTLTVTAPAGATVTVYKDSKTKTKVADSSGMAVFKGLCSGEWTITMTDGEQTSVPQTVTITADYAATITFFAAAINITYPAGSVCTVTDGVITLTAPDTSGAWACVVPNAGTWTVSCTDGSKTSSKSVDITMDGQVEDLSLAYELILYADGYIDTVVGGWRGSSALSGFGAGISITDEGTRLKVSCTSTTSVNGLVFTTNKIDLTNFTTLTADVTIQTAFQAGRMVITSTIADSGHAAVNYGSGTIKIDVSALVGSYYIGYCAYNDTYNVKQSVVYLNNVKLL